MALLTGDIKGKLAIVKSCLVHIRCPHILDEERASKGSVHELTPFIFYALHRFSRHVASLAGAVELGGRRGKSYLQGVLKFVREEFGISSGVTISQWLSEGYAERKLIFIHRLIVACQEYHKHASRQHRLEQLKTKRGRQGATERPATEPLDGPTSSARKFENTELPEDRDAVRFDDACVEQRCLDFVKGAQSGVEFSPAARPSMRPRTPPDLPRHLPEALQELKHFQQPLEKNTDTSKADLHTKGASLWLAALSQQVEQLQVRAQRADDGIKATSLSTATLQSNTEAHLRVLEGRVLGLERRWTAPIPIAFTHVPPTASDNKPHHSDQLSIYGTPEATHLPRECARENTSAPAACHRQGAIDAPNDETPGKDSTQCWMKWNSPTACFNPLYVQPISIIDNTTTTSSTSKWATPPPANPTAGSPASPSSSQPCPGLHTQDVKHASCSEDTGMGDLISCLNARLDEAYRLLAQVRRTVA